MVSPFRRCGEAPRSETLRYDRYDAVGERRDDLTSSPLNGPDEHSSFQGRGMETTSSLLAPVLPDGEVAQPPLGQVLSLPLEALLVACPMGRWLAPTLPEWRQGPPSPALPPELAVAQFPRLALVASPSE
jgi:hypothetical protein